MHQKQVLTRSICSIAVCIATGIIAFQSSLALAGSIPSKPKPTPIVMAPRVNVYSAVIEGTIEPSVNGQAKRIEVKSQNSARLGSAHALPSMSKDAFEGAILIPVWSPSLNITDEATAKDAEVNFLLSHEGAPYAECILDFSSIEKNTGTVGVLYRLAVRDIGGHLQERFGVCDRDLTKSGMQPGVPKVQADDEVSAEVAGIPIALGTFSLLSE